MGTYKTMQLVKTSKDSSRPSFSSVERRLRAAKKTPPQKKLLPRNKAGKQKLDFIFNGLFFSSSKKNYAS